MSVLVHVPAPLRSKAGGRRQIELSAHSFGALLDEMEAAYPGITARLQREDGTLRHELSIYVNGENIRFLQGLDTPLQDGDEVSIIPAVAGGKAIFEACCFPHPDVEMNACAGADEAQTERSAH